MPADYPLPTDPRPTLTPGLTMKLIGIPLRRPNFAELTASSILAVGLWMACLGLMRAASLELGRADAGALLIVVAWACLSTRVGIRVGMGQRHLAANLLVSGVLLGTYELARAFAG